MIRLVFVFILLWVVADAQESKTIIKLDDCYRLAEANYPLAKKRELITLTREFTLDNIAKGYYPGIDIQAQASHQSDVTKLPLNIPDVAIPNLEQYRVYGEISQILYDGGIIKHQKETALAHSKVQQQQIEVDLYTVKQRVNDLYFGILIFDEKIRQNELLKYDLSMGLSTVESQLTNGTAYRSSLDLLKAEYMKADQLAVSIRSYRKSYTDMLGHFINIDLADNVQLETPPEVLNFQEIKRPELELLNYRIESLELSKEALSAGNRPRLYLFAQGGIANPGLNFLKSVTDWYYVGGLKLNWPLTGFYTSKKQKQIIDGSKRILEADKEIFLFNTTQLVKQQDAEVDKLRQLLASDSEIIKLRNTVKKAALAQLKNGVITPADYLREVNEENEAIQNSILHRTELLFAQYRHKLITG